MAVSTEEMQEFAGHVADLSQPLYGKYRGIVTDDQDPQHRGRLRVKIATLFNTQALEWALPCLPYGGTDTVGSYWVPPVGARVWVEFEQGNVASPIWSGTYWAEGVDPPDKDPAVVSLQTPFGHRLAFDDTDGSEKITLLHAGDGEPSLVFDEKGRVTVNDGAGAQVVLNADAGEVTVADANGNSIVLSSGRIKIEDGSGQTVTLDSYGATIKANSITLDASSVSLGGAGGEPVIKGQSFLQLFMTHTHPTGVGPSGPPIPQGEMSTLSKTATTT